MKRVTAIVAVLALSGTISACNKKENSQPAAAAKVEQVERIKIVPGQMKDSELAFAFLSGIQNNDKQTMYAVSNLTPEMVEESRNKLTNTTKYKQTKKERAATEHALRMSGSIDFFLKKLTKILPKSAQLQVIKTTQEAKAEGSMKVHHVKITYGKKEEALVDKKGKQAKEIVVRLQQIRHMVNGHTLQEFVFDNQDFEKMSDKEYEVLSYY